LHPPVPAHAEPAHPLRHRRSGGDEPDALSTGQPLAPAGAPVLARHAHVPVARAARPRAGADQVAHHLWRAPRPRRLWPGGCGRPRVDRPFVGARAREHQLHAGGLPAGPPQRLAVSTKRDRYAGQGSIHGVVVVDKPTGPTSHDLVAAARRHFGTRRVGHAGTLDPMATGVLVLLLGEATKLSSHLTRAVKTYEAVFAFGSSTTTLDAQGTVTRRRALTAGWLSEETLPKALQAELERELQIPPAVSAIKVGG